MRLARITGAIAALLFAALAVLSNLWLQPAGQLVFDSRVAGYSLAEARAFLEVLNADQVALYLGLFRWIDTVFPVLLAVTLVALIANRKGRDLLRGVAAIAAFLYLFFDLRENALVARMLKTSENLSEELVASASMATMVKWGALAVSFGVLLWVIWRERRGARI